MNAIDFDPGPATIVIFGASGDLTRRKLIPALYNNYRKKRLSKRIRIIGFARRDWNDNYFRNRLNDGVRQYEDTSFNKSTWNDFAGLINYFRGDLDAPEDYRRLQSHLASVEEGPTNRLYYLATPPNLYGGACKHLAAAGMVRENEARRNIVIEKPFGRDLASARELNRQVHAAFSEHQV